MENITSKKENPILYKEKEKCCGCSACFAICPKNAIDMVQDKNGFKYPKVNLEKCIYCYQCVKVCPIH